MKKKELISIIVPSYNSAKTIKLCLDAIYKQNYSNFEVIVVDEKDKDNSYEIAKKYDVPVLFHTGWPPPGTPGHKMQISKAHPALLDDVIGSFPKLKIIMSHCGYPWSDIAIAMATQFPNVYLDISNLMYMVPNKMRDILLHAKEVIGLNKIDQIYPNWRMVIEEVAIEASPNSIPADKELIVHLKNLGLTRVNIGIQTLCADELEKLGRRKNEIENVYKSIDFLKEIELPNISVDLINGIPGQTDQSWGQSISKIIQLNPDTISTYFLTVRPDAKLSMDYNQNDIIILHKLYHEN